MRRTNNRENLVLTIIDNESEGGLGGVTVESKRNYAEKIGAKFLVVEADSEGRSNGLSIIFDLLTRYQRLIYLDNDCIVREDCPNLFTEVPVWEIGLFNEGQFSDRLNLIRLGCKKYKMEIKKWGGDYYNTGVMVISRRHRFLFKPPDDRMTREDQDVLLNLRILNEDYKVYELDYHFNRMANLDPLTGEDRQASYIVHYSGSPDLEETKKIAIKDLNLWSNGFKGTKHILIHVTGGMGDQVCAEPVIRWGSKNVYRDNEITVLSDWPEIFEPLKEEGLIAENIKQGNFEPKPDTPYFEIRTVPGPETITWRVVSHAMCHGVDFISMTVMRRILPDSEKRPRLKFDLSSIQKLMDLLGIRSMNDLVLVHPGRHWPSKTFPGVWWESVVSGLIKEGVPIALIGKDISNDQGYVEMDCPDGAIDLRDMLATDSLFALIAQAKLLISNDSAPVHIAGAFDNYILLIPTVKHPDHVLPYRNGNKYYKAEAIYKRLTCDAYDSSPTQVHGQTLEDVVGDILDYIPDPKKVVEAAARMYREK